MSKRTCGNCVHRAFYSWSGHDYCYWYEIASTDEEEEKYAADCDRYEEGTPDCLRRDEYCPSASAGDYSPSNPAAAPGMSWKDFI